MKPKIVGYSVALALLLLISYFFVSKEITIEKIKRKDLASIIELAKEGNIDAQRELGIRYENGNEKTEPDIEKAKEWYAVAAAQNDASSQYLLGFIYETKLNVSEGIEKAKSYYKQAATQSHPKALTRLAHMYRDGLYGYPKDNPQAKKLYEQAAEQGDEIAQYSLANFYLLGQGVEQNYLKALSLFEKAATSNHSDSQFELGKMYEKGLGVRQDREKAKEWYGKVCDGGFQHGCEEYRRLNEAGF